MNQPSPPDELWLPAYKLADIEIWGCPYTDCGSHDSKVSQQGTEVWVETCENCGREFGVLKPGITQATLIVSESSFKFRIAPHPLDPNANKGGRN